MLLSYFCIFKQAWQKSSYFINYQRGHRSPSHPLGKTFCSPRNQDIAGQTGQVQRICDDKFVKQCKAIDTWTIEQGLTVNKFFWAACLGPLGPRAPCMAGFAGAVVTHLIIMFTLHSVVPQATWRAVTLNTVLANNVTVTPYIQKSISYTSTRVNQFSAERCNCITKYRFYHRMSSVCPSVYLSVMWV